MGITAKTGDAGWTVLMFNRRVRKDDVRLHVIGTLDELISFLGLAKCKARRKWVKKLIHSCQHDLIIVTSEFAAIPRDLPRLALRVDAAMIGRIEDETRKLEEKVNLKVRGFVIPGENETSALLDVCRAVARRAERQAVAIRRRMATPPRAVKYLNRLSDLLYLLAGAEEKTRAVFRAGAKRQRKSRKGQ